MLLAIVSDIRHGRRCAFALHVHLVFVTKYRRKVFDGCAIRRLKVVFEKICTDFEAQLVEMNGGRTRTLAHPLPAEALGVEHGQQSQRRFQSPAPYQRPDIEKRY
jgi:putative transposase